MDFRRRIMSVAATSLLLVVAPACDDLGDDGGEVGGSGQG
jgi:hypothetical protein